MDEALEDILKTIFDQARWVVLGRFKGTERDVYIRSKMAAMPKPPPPQMHSNP